MNVEVELDKNLVRRALHDAAGRRHLRLVGNALVPCLPCGKPCGKPYAVLTEDAPKRFAEWVMKASLDSPEDVIDELLERVRQ